MVSFGAMRRFPTSSQSGTIASVVRTTHIPENQPIQKSFRAQIIQQTKKTDFERFPSFLYRIAAFTAIYLPKQGNISSSHREHIEYDF